MLRRVVGLGTALALVALGMGAAAPARAAVVTCGQVVTVDTTLDSNVGPCASDGVVIGAANVTLKLNGHKILGAPSAGDTAGVRVNFGGATIQGPGDITGFDGGVAKLVAGDGVRVQDLRIFGNGAQAANTLGDGIVLSGGTGHQVLRNTIFDNGPYSGVTLLGAVVNSVIEGNTIYENTRQQNATLTEVSGIRLENISTVRPTFITIRNNTIRANGLEGIALFAGASDNLIVGNTVQANGFHNKTHRKGDGIRMFAGGARNQILDNLVYSNAANGIFLQGPAGTFGGTTTNQIRRNRSLQNNALRAGGFDLFDGNLSPPCDANVWQGNQYRTFNQPCVTAP